MHDQPTREGWVHRHGDRPVASGNAHGTVTPARPASERRSRAASGGARCSAWRAKGTGEARSPAGSADELDWLAAEGVGAATTRRATHGPDPAGRAPHDRPAAIPGQRPVNRVRLGTDCPRNEPILRLHRHDRSRACPIAIARARHVSPLLRRTGQRERAGHSSGFIPDDRHAHRHESRHRRVGELYVAVATSERGQCLAVATQAGGTLRPPLRSNTADSRRCEGQSEADGVYSCRATWRQSLTRDVDEVLRPGGSGTAIRVHPRSIGLDAWTALVGLHGATRQCSAYHAGACRVLCHSVFKRRHRTE